MTNEFSRMRRFAAALLAVACAAVLFRGAVAQALVIRGDDYLYRGDRAAAVERYRRAMTIAPSYGTAFDRYVFVTMQHQNPRALHDAVDVAGTYLRAHPRDAALLTDRALCLLHLRRFSEAQDDFTRAASIAQTAESYAFAGWAANRNGDEASARSLWRRALELSPHYRPAEIALREAAR